jgi:hypothetical protein
VAPARVEERQTRGSQKALPSRACGFESRPGHLIDVGENANRLSNALLVLRELVHLSSGQLAREPRFEVKALLADHLHDDAQAVGKLHARRTELGGEHGAPAPELAGFLDRASRTDDPREYVAIAYGELKPALLAAIGLHLERVDPLVDEPTFRLLTALLHRQERHVTELPAERAGVVLDDLGALPLAAGERSLRVLPLERPARDEFVEVVEQPGAHPVHDLMSAKLYVAEMTARRSHEHAGMPWEFHADMARICWDNVRHAEVLDRLMAAELGCHWGDHPVALAPPVDGLPGEIPEGVAAYLRADEAQHARITARWG